MKKYLKKSGKSLTKNMKLSKNSKNGVEFLKNVYFPDPFSAREARREKKCAKRRVRRHAQTKKHYAERHTRQGLAWRAKSKSVKRVTSGRKISGESIRTKENWYASLEL